MMRIGVRLPHYASDWETLRDRAVQCEELGFDGLWVNDHFQSPGRLKRDPTFEALTTLAGLAQHTHRTRLGIAVLSASYRFAPVAVKSLATINAMAPGRLVVGLGSGSDRDEHHAYGIMFAPPMARTARLELTIDVMRAMAETPDGATVEGMLNGAPNHPPAHPPIWVAAHKRVGLQIAGSSGDGVVGAFLTPHAFAKRRDVAEEARLLAGRPPLAYCLYTFALPDLPETDRWLADQASALNSTPGAIRRWLAGTGIVAPPDELRGRLTEFAAVGVTDVVLAYPDRMPRDAWDALAEAVL
jgi:alkanesulfonate monooxygenase SsuD/methylene tetrahydromethanopterin reductase-like flavin-dependent oxidoreductase (luciferase family)